MAKASKSCSFHSRKCNETIGKMFGLIFHSYFGEGGLIISDKGPDKDQGKIILEFPKKWILANGLAKRPDIYSAFEHISTCKNKSCANVFAMMKKLLPFFEKKRLPGFDSEEMAYILKINSIFPGKRIFISELTGFGGLVSELLPYAVFFKKNKKLWKW